MANGTAKSTTGRIKIFATYQGIENGKYINALTVFDWKTKQLNWLQLPDNTWVNCGSTFQYAAILTYPSTVPPPPPPPVGTSLTVNTIELTDDAGVAWINPFPVVLVKK
jgi:hypothetical protein